MTNDDLPASTSYRVVVNDEQQYSIWPLHKDLPLGWSDGGFAGTQDACLAHIEEVWTDMRPLSLRVAMAEAPPGPTCT
jgi:MbtH protein